mmetsp:Transcript_40973/g.92415  ORF Transcript_40973/g.92415 Transcript_40973/m.92415 type:complete len:211 (+) Transcript_40973:560-1192(+)
MEFRRFPHTHIIQFIMPMLVIMLLSIGTLFMGQGHIGNRVNVGFKGFLGLLTVTFVTARQRPAVAVDVWLDRFQTHTLLLCCMAVVGSVAVDYSISATWCKSILPSLVVDAAVRVTMVGVAWWVVHRDFAELEEGAWEPLGAASGSSEALLLQMVNGVLMMLTVLGAISMGTLIFTLMRNLRKRMPSWKVQNGAYSVVGPSAPSVDTAGA